MLFKNEEEAVGSFGKIIAWAAFLAFDLIILGSLVRATDSGLACPDWPLCYNQIAPAMDMQIFLEWFHRLSALILGGVLLVAAFKIYKYPVIRKSFGTQLYVAGVLFLSQCILGGLTVLKLLDPTTVSMHLINALVFFAVLLWVAIDSWMKTKKKKIIFRASPKAKYVLIGFSVLILAQILLGGMVSSNHAGLVCPDFPKCHDQWMPEGSFLVQLQMFHRFFAFFILACSLGINLLFYRPGGNAFFNFSVRILPTLVILQILLGIVNVFYSLPVWASVAHLANALVLFTISFSASILLYSAESFEQISKGEISKSAELDFNQKNLTPSLK